MTSAPTTTCDSEFDPHTLSVDEARRNIIEAIRPLIDNETVTLIQAVNRVLAQDVFAAHSIPNTATAAMDGFALIGSDLDIAYEQGLRIVGTVLAGHPLEFAIEPGTCVRIMTGAAITSGADTVVMQEHCTVTDDGMMRVNANQRSGQHTRKIGDDLLAGALALCAGTRLRPAHIGILASCGCAEIKVCRRARIALFSTGDELVPVGNALPPGFIHDSNRYSLHALLQELPVDIIDLGIVADDPLALRSAFIEASSTADLIIASGGVSVGNADHTKAVIQELGSLTLWKIAMKPGRPLAFGHINGKPTFGLPGNPVSAMVTAYQFVIPGILQLLGGKVQPKPRFRIRCRDALSKKPGRLDFQRGRLVRDENGEWIVTTTGNQGSGRLSSFTQADCLIVLPTESADVPPGQWVEIEPL